uniref:non-specific serine/threonine protein kinase n=1 Tax=Pipistrellus kuhlii TaxID=59472 RepID=A0A7J7ZJ44_PIPKU|nr:hypothetical protein mPipKuh1_009495 [Pipistrellus kuhlii]
MPRFSVPTTTKGQSIGDYVLEKSIGKGACSQVRLARHVPTGTQVVVKTIFQRDVGVSSSSQELRCLRTLQHRNISQLLEVVVDPEEVHLVMEYVRGGDLKAHLERHHRLTERQARVVFRQVFLALHLCHRRGFAHLDIKPDNILLEEDLTAKLADFGLSHEATELLTSWCGTLYYMAPEVLRGEPYDGRKADVWGLGASLYKAVMGRVPFLGYSKEKILELIVEGHYQPPYYMSEAGRSFLQRLLTVDPDQRPTLEEAMRMPWMDLGPEDLPPDSEPPGEDLDPQVVETMRGMGFREEDIRDSVAGQTFDRIMGTYRILLMTMGRMAMGRMPGRTVQVRPYRPPDTGAATPPSREESRASGGSSGPSVASPPCLWAKKTSAPPPPPSLETIAFSPLPLEPVQVLQPEGSPRPSMVRPLCLGVKKTYAPPAPPPSLEAIAASPLPLEPVQALQPGTRCPAPQLRPGGAPTPCTSNQFPSSDSKAVKAENEAVKVENEAVKVENEAVKAENEAVKVENQEGAPPDSSPQEGSPPASPAASTRARPGLAQRAWKTFLKVFCCGVDTTKPRRKRTRVQPGNT